MLARRAETAKSEAHPDRQARVVLPANDAPRLSLEAGVEIGERLVEESTRRARLEQEAEILRSLSHSLCRNAIRLRDHAEPGQAKTIAAVVRSAEKLQQALDVTASERAVKNG